jgi:hypothetical protein
MVLQLGRTSARFALICNQLELAVPGRFSDNSALLKRFSAQDCMSCNTSVLVAYVRQGLSVDYDALHLVPHHKRHGHQFSHFGVDQTLVQDGNGLHNDGSDMTRFVIGSTLIEPMNGMLGHRSLSTALNPEFLH